MNKILNKYIPAIILASLALPSVARNNFTISLNPNESAPVIEPEIYGQFAEHLGNCIYGGIWVGEDSEIPNTNGYRNDVLNAFKELKIPVLRWPGGCFADEYHWLDGIGPKETRPHMVNNNWGGTVEDNSFGTHEFFNLCEILGTEPYLSGNVGSGSVEELAKWVEYITAEDGPMAKIRKENGREKPWKLKYLGVGNESWGCGGSFTPEYYSDVYRRYQTYCRNYNGNKLFKIASGASDYDYNWTDVLMERARNHMNGISLHYYTVTGWRGSKGAATKFTDDDYYWTLGKCLEIGEVIRKHCDIMDKHDPQNKVALLVDEWGTWWDVEPGTNPGFLYQQNTMRDAMVAALTLNTFHNFSDRVKMANIAQIANVLQSMVLTKDAEMVLTPSYYVFKMYIPHQGAKLIPLSTNTSYRQTSDKRLVPVINATASQKDGKTTISIVNTDLKKECDINIPLKSITGKKITGKILTASDIHDYNDFGQSEKVSLKNYDDATIKHNILQAKLPPMSIVTFSIE